MKTKKTASETLELAYEQMQEDRKTILASYGKFSEQMNDLNDYAVNGANVNKCLELLTKQTAQLLELAKIQGASSKKKEEEDNNLSSEDKNSIYAGLKDVSLNARR